MIWEWWYHVVPDPPVTGKLRPCDPGPHSRSRTRLPGAAEGPPVHESGLRGFGVTVSIGSVLRVRLLGQRVREHPCGANGVNLPDAHGT